ncbi:hypothetical protein C7S14_6592 [Burkholderia cepacia]|nr:hypothetical protein C7S14_6592 [Burkholderia cepacia]
MSRVESGGGGGAPRAPVPPGRGRHDAMSAAFVVSFNRLLRSAAIGGGLTRRRSRPGQKGALLCRIKYVLPDSAAYTTRFTQLLSQSE